MSYDGFVSLLFSFLFLLQVGLDFVLLTMHQMATPPIVTAEPTRRTL